MAQKNRRRIVSRIIAAVVCSALIGLSVVVFLQWNSAPISYDSFINRSPEYYAQMAEACDALLLQLPKGSATNLSISGGDTSLPPAIRFIHSDVIIVSSNRVYIGMGNGGRASYAIIWERKENSALWQLSSVVENYTRIHYTK